jgi:hypothetical protein
VPGPESAGAPAARPWLRWVRALQSIAQAGLTYADDPYDAERYHEIRRLAAEVAAAHTSGDPARIESLFASERGYPTPKMHGHPLHPEDSYKAFFACRPSSGVDGLGAGRRRAVPPSSGAASCRRCGSPG